MSDYDAALAAVLKAAVDVTVALVHYWDAVDALDIATVNQLKPLSELNP